MHGSGCTVRFDLDVTPGFIERRGCIVVRRNLFHRVQNIEASGPRVRKQIEMDGWTSGCLAQFDLECNGWLDLEAAGWSSSFVAKISPSRSKVDAADTRLNPSFTLQARKWVSVGYCRG
jgi:hypothetical protein